MGHGKTYSVVLVGLFVAQTPLVKQKHSSPAPDMGAATAQLTATPNSSRRGIYTRPTEPSPNEEEDERGMVDPR